MKYYLFAALLFAGRVSAQNRVPLLTVDEMNNRMANGGDTTYVVNFWATWCVPCLKELPAFETLTKTAQDKKLKVLLVSVDETPKAVRSLPAFIKKRKLQNEVWLLNEKNLQVFIDRIDKDWSGSIPATLMVKGKQRRFFEKTFTYPELLTEYRKMQ